MHSKRTINACHLPQPLSLVVHYIPGWNYPFGIKRFVHEIFNSMYSLQWHPISEPNFFSVQYQISILTVCIHMSKEDEYKQGFSHNVFQQIFEAGYMGTCTCLSNIEAWEVIHVGWLVGWLACFLGLLAFGSTSLFYRMWPREHLSMVH